jgi:hypothetical protein
MMASVLVFFTQASRGGGVIFEFPQLVLFKKNHYFIEFNPAD